MVVKNVMVRIARTGNGYFAYAPEYDGCVAAGDTMEETKRLMAEALESHLAGMAEDGEPPADDDVVYCVLPVPVPSA